MKEGRSHCKNRKIKNFVTYRQNSSLIRMFKGKENKSAVNSNKNSKSNIIKTIVKNNNYNNNNSGNGKLISYSGRNNRRKKRLIK